MSSASSVATQSVHTAFKNAGVVVLGGGPVGSFVAALLDQSGIPCTLVEKQLDFLNVDVTRSWAFGVTRASVERISAVPGLAKAVLPEEPVLARTVYRIFSDGSFKEMTVMRGLEKRIPVRYLRHRLSHVMKTYVEKDTKNVETMYGAQCTGIGFAKNGEMEVHVAISKEDKPDEGTVEEEKRTLRSRLVLACDGANSFALQELQREENQAASNVHSTHGLHRVSVNSPSVGLVAKSIRLNQNYYKHLNDIPTNFEECIISIQPVHDGRPDSDCFRLVVLTHDTDDGKLRGALLATVVVTGGKDILRVDDVEEGYRAFERNFPQLRVRECISKESMEEFVSNRGTEFSPIIRPGSIVAHVGGARDSTSGGVVLMGDAAHSGPPDLGQGLNFGLGDAYLFHKCISEASDADSLRSVLERYEGVRGVESQALARVMRYASPFQYGQNDFMALLGVGNEKMRMMLSKIAPWLFSPSARTMLRMRKSFKEIDRRAMTTTRRLQVIAGVLLGVPIAMFASMCRKRE